ncbi:MAG: head fiber protein [Acidobacteriota bacterium]
MSNVKNYTEQGGEKTVIGGTLEIAPGGMVTGLPSGFTPAAFQANSTANNVSGLVNDFNSLLVKLKTAGLMASS